MDTRRPAMRMAEKPNDVVRLRQPPAISLAVAVAAASPSEIRN